MVLQTFDHWSIVPGKVFRNLLESLNKPNELKYRDLGDPLDKAIQLKPLEPSSANALSRDILLKIRRRKGEEETLALLHLFI
jgi:116 kDa U5 small nuclear ribonucleoprotein component